MSQSDNPYTLATGEGYLGTYSVSAERWLHAYVGASVLREIGAQPGDRVGVHPHPDGVVLASPPLDRELVVDEPYTVGARGQVTLGATVLREHVGAEGVEAVRVYRCDAGLLVVPGGDDPRVDGGGEA